MRHRRITLWATALALGLAATSAAPGHADPVGGTWVFTVRLLRVDLRDPSLAETASPGLVGGTATTAAWSDLLLEAKQRGTVTLLLDQSVTGVAGVPVTVMQRRSRQIAAFLRKDLGNEYHQAANIDTGGEAELHPSPEGDRFDYKIEAKLAGSAPEEGSKPLTWMVAWRGCHPPLDGATLVLRYAEQPDPAAGTQSATEIYAFLTAARR